MVLQNDTIKKKLLYKNNGFSSLSFNHIVLCYLLVIFKLLNPNRHYGLILFVKNVAILIIQLVLGIAIK